MKFYSGSYFCTKSCWTGKLYIANNLVSIEKYDEEYGTADFIKLTVPNREFQSIQLQQEVTDWLNANIKNTKDEPGWCMGNEEYRNISTSLSMMLWFYRRRDALAFIRHWSCYKKPTHTYNQNTYVSKALDLKSKKLKLC